MPVDFTTLSKIVKGTTAPSTPKGAVAGNLTPGLLLFSAPGKGANLVPLPAVWYSAADIEPDANLDASSASPLSSANLAALVQA